MGTVNNQAFRRAFAPLAVVLFLSLVFLAVYLQGGSAYPPWWFAFLYCFFAFGGLAVGITFGRSWGYAECRKEHEPK